MMPGTQGPLLRARVLSYAAAVALLAPHGAYAQLTTASIAVQVRGPSPAQVVIRLLPVGRIERGWSGSTDVRGRLLFPKVAPGAYRVVLPAFDNMSNAQPLEVGPGEILTIEIDPAAGTVTRTHRGDAGYRTNFSKRDLAVLPSSADVWSVIETVEPIALADRMDTGGISTGEPAMLGSHASSWTQASFFEGPVNVTSALAGGTPLLYPDINDLGALSIVTADAPLEVASPGPVTVLIPAAPSSLWHWSVDADVSPHDSRVRPATGPPSIQALTSWTHGALAGGGPIGPRAGITAALSSTRSTHTERDAAAKLPGNVDSISLGLQAVPHDASTIDAHADVQRAVHPFDGRARLQDRSAIAHDRFAAVTAGWHAGSASPRWIDVGLQSASTTVVSSSPRNGTIERLRDAPVPQLALSNPGSRMRWTIGAGTAPGFGGFDRGRHAFTFAAELSRSSAAMSTIGQGPIGEEVDGVPARAWVYTPGTLSPRATTAAVYADDRYTPLGRVTIDAGLRVEAVSGSSGGTSQRVRVRDAEPRLSLRWSAWKTLSLFGSGRRYDETLPLIDLAFGDPSAPQASIYRWDDPNGDGSVQPGELGALIARAGPGSAGGVSGIDPHLARPHTDEVVLGFDATLARWRVRVAGVATHERHLLALTDSVAPLYTVTYIADPGLDLGSAVDDQQLPIYARPPATFGRDRYLLTNPAGLDAAFNGVELTISGAAGPVTTLFGAAAMHSHGPSANRGFLPTENDQGLPGELLVNPNASTFADGRLYFDPGYSIKWSAVYSGPRGISLAVAARYQDGQNFARMVIATGLPQGPEAIRAYPDGRSKFTYRFNSDAHLEKRFALGRGHVSAVLEAYNLFNTANEVEENVVTGPAFRTATALQPARVFRAGVRIAY